LESVLGALSLNKCFTNTFEVICGLTTFLRNRQGNSAYTEYNVRVRVVFLGPLTY